MSKQLSYLITSAIIRRGDDVLLVSQQGPGEAAPHWALPGGRVEAGEVLPEALAREVREETGLTLVDPGRLQYVVQLDPGDYLWAVDQAPAAAQVTIFVFAVAEWSGEPQSADPDGFVRECRFVPIAEAARLIEGTVPWAVAREPAVAWLRGEVAPGTLWVYRREAPERDRLLYRLS